LVLLLGYDIIDTTPTPNIKDTLHNLADDIVVGNLIYTVVSIDVKKEIIGVSGTGSANGIFLIVDLEVENTGSEVGHIEDNVYILDNKGNEIAEGSDSKYLLDDAIYVSDEVVSGASKVGKLLFDIPIETIGVIAIRADPSSSDSDVFVSWA